MLQPTVGLRNVLREDGEIERISRVRNEFLEVSLTNRTDWVDVRCAVRHMLTTFTRILGAAWHTPDEQSYFVK